MTPISSTTDQEWASTLGLMARVRRWEQRVFGDCPEARCARWVFLRFLGVIYGIAFLSLGSQLLGLIGHDGILPTAQFLHVIQTQFGVERYWLAPTLCWLNASDLALHGLCVAGFVFSVLLLLDVAPALALLCLWVIYLSFVTVGRDFLAFQWDNLLLETGWLAMLIAPLRLRPGSANDPSPTRIGVWLLRWLLFRLMVSSGVVKLASGDPSWRHLTALTVHFETQPLPTWIGWHLHQWPLWWHQASCAVMFSIELLVPFFIFGSRCLRSLACAILVAFQLLIMATGNYCFFNLLTIALCLLLLDDAVWPKRWREFVDRSNGASVQGRRWPWWVLAPMTAVVLLVTSIDMSGRLIRWTPSWTPLMMLERAVTPFRTLNSYGLFAVMTTTRHEIVVEGSQDGQTWLPYEFTDKPGDPARRPRFIAPHQPRLDWQMWFAALGSYQQNPWFFDFCRQVLRGSPAVLRLLARNPFPTAPPRYLRAVMYEYRFTDWATRRRTGQWWQRQREGLYCPVLSLHAS